MVWGPRQQALSSFFFLAPHKAHAEATGATGNGFCGFRIPLSLLWFGAVPQSAVPNKEVLPGGFERSRP